MSWSKSLVTLLELSEPLVKAIEDKDELSIDNVAEDKSLSGAVDNLVGFLTDSSEIDNLLQASKKMLEVNKKLTAKDPSTLTADELQAMGVSAAAAAVLSAEALKQSLSTKALVKYTLKELWPVVKTVVTVVLPLL